jgi:hypothetical protein
MLLDAVLQDIRSWVLEKFQEKEKSAQKSI